MRKQILILLNSWGLELACVHYFRVFLSSLGLACNPAVVQTLRSSGDLVPEVAIGSLLPQKDDSFEQMSH